MFVQEILAPKEIDPDLLGCQRDNQIDKLQDLVDHVKEKRLTTRFDRG